MKVLQHLPLFVLCLLCSNAMAQGHQDSPPAPIPTPMIRTEQVRVVSTTPIATSVTPVSSDCLPAHPPGMTIEADSFASVCAAPVTQSIFKVVYEQGGRQYSVQLPHDPGEFITLQLPEMPTAPAPIADAQQISTTAPLPATVPTAVISPFPAVLFMGATYASFPYLGPRRIQGWSGGMRGRMGGRRH